MCSYFYKDSQISEFSYRTLQRAPESDDERYGKLQDETDASEHAADNCKHLNLLLFRDTSMLGLQECFSVLFQCRALRLRQCEVAETFPYIIDGLSGRMHHIFRIETVIPQLVHHDFISREIYALPRMVLHHALRRHQQGALTELVSVRPVFQMTYRTHSEDETLARLPPDQ